MQPYEGWVVRCGQDQARDGKGRQGIKTPHKAGLVPVPLRITSSLLPGEPPCLAPNTC